MQVLLCFLLTFTVCEFTEFYDLYPFYGGNFDYSYFPRAPCGESCETPCRQCPPSPAPPRPPQPPQPPQPLPPQPPPQRCNKEYLVIRKLANWHQAMERCKGMGSQLVSIPNEQEWVEVKKAIVLAGSPANYWTSGTNLQQYDTYVWATTWEPFTFRNWAPGEPNNWLGNQHCAFIKARHFTWDDWDCNGLHYYICEKFRGNSDQCQQSPPCQTCSYSQITY
uniref:C-type lectin domain-containing protein n=1 Tax=Graphocephala atropunctata TaxID=36148 RepID=A0A1B6LPW0_9HEMI